MGGTLAVAPGLANAQVGSSNVPLPNVMLLLDTSGSFEYMINGSNPEDAANNPTNGPYANCEQAFNNATSALPNRWGVLTQALTGTVLNNTNQPFYSCVTMDRSKGPPATSLTYGVQPGTGAGGGTGPIPTWTMGAPFVLATSGSNAALTGQVESEGLDIQYGIRNENGGAYSIPYDSGYYLPFHRPVSFYGTPGTPLSTNQRCVVSPHVLPGASSVGGVGIANGYPSSTDCPNEGGNPCTSLDFPPDAIGAYFYDTLANGTASGTPITTTLTTPNAGYASGVPCASGNAQAGFLQATDGLMDQAASLVRFGMMTYDNDPDPSTGTSVDTSPYGSPFLGQWSYFPGWNTFPTPTPTPISALCGTSATYNDTCGTPAGCTNTPFELGARNPTAPPWEGRLIGFPNPNADVLATVQANAKIQTAITAMRPYGATPTAALMSDAAYYFWGDTGVTTPFIPGGPGAPTSNQVDPLVAGACRSQYIILLTDGSPNQDERTACQGAGGLCPYHMPEETAYLLSHAASDMSTTVYTKLPAPPANGNVYTYVIGFAVSGDNIATTGADGGATSTGANASNPNLANCAQLTPTQLANCGASGTIVDSTDGGVSADSPCCALQRVAVAGGTGHAYFADTPGDLNAALAAVLGDIEGQLGSRTIPVASPTVAVGASGPVTATFVSTFQAASTCPTTGPCSTASAWTGDVQRQETVCGTASATASADDDFSVDLTHQNSTGVARNFIIFNGFSGSSSGATTSTNALTIRPYLNTFGFAGAGLPDKLDTFGSAGSQSGDEVTTTGAPTGITTELTASCYTNTSTNVGYCPAVGVTSTSCQDPATLGYLDAQSCANLAVAFTLGLQTFTPSSTGGTAATNLASQFSTGTDGNNTGPATNRWASPFGAILDSTPAVVGVPAAQVRDDSYQAFVSAVTSATVSPPRDTMLYVATVDGLLHAFDTTVGYPATPPVTNVEAWAFIPPAVLPHILSSYPAANGILLDGSPIVKDVVFSRTSPTVAGPNIPAGESPWHTMLVAGFGSGGRGYYAMDVTDPRVSGVHTPAFTDYLTHVTSGASPTLSPSGPHFQWQITGVNLAGNSTYAPAITSSTELFGNTSGTPAIATVFADPSMQSASTVSTGLSPQEIGIAILPGGTNGAPVSGLTCPRELYSNYSAYSTSSPLFSGINMGKASQLSASSNVASAFNLSDPNFRPRVQVRQWGATCGTNVPGRSVMVVSVATGQVLAVFARHTPSSWTSSKAANTWDVPSDGSGTPFINSQLLIPTPLDSPMTGTPVVYPSGVGVVAQTFYLGDADGTLWRFDISDPNPLNWSGAIFADAYSPAADNLNGNGGLDLATAGPAAPDGPALDSEPISVPPVLALDSTATLTVNFSTGDQTAFNACYSVPGLSPTVVASKNQSSFCTTYVKPTAVSGPVAPATNFLYSVAETRGGSGSTPLARVNWFNEFTSGERVTGPMAVFNGILYFATYTPSTSMGGSTWGSAPTAFAASSACDTGGPNLYAWDFVHPAPSCSYGPGSPQVGCGGGGSLDPNFTDPSAGSTDLGSSSKAGQGRLHTIANPTGSPPALPSNTVVPGVTVGQTPSCVTVLATPQDAYSGALHNAFTSSTGGTYTLTANIGKKSVSGASSNIVKQAVKSPTSPTIVDSWASIAE